MAQLPIGNGTRWDKENTGQSLWDDHKLLGETDFLRWGLGGQTPAMGDDADNFPLSDARPVKKKRTRAPDNTVDTTISVDNWLPIDPALPPAALQPDGGRDLSIAAPKVDDDKLMREILEIFPDISRQYVLELLAARQTPHSNDGANTVDTFARVKEDLIEDILAQDTYPKQEKTKRKLERTVDNGNKWERATVADNDPSYFQNACDLLGQEFLRVPANYIRQVMKEKKRLYAAFLTIYRQEVLSAGPDIPYLRLKRPRISDAGKYWKFGNLAELYAAEHQARQEKLALEKRIAEEELERRNEEESSRTGTLVECQCCYTDIPLNRAMPCEGETAHFFCVTCIRKSAETQIGLMKWRLQCFDISGCQAQFDRSRLKQTLGSSVMEKLDSLQQEDEIQQAGLEGLECCPFCDFKAICGPVEEDREFHCQNPACEKISCRLCKDVTHVPKTCQEAREEKGLPVRHAVEEAMSEALIRNCPRCKVKIVKEHGCNRMLCSKCGCNMCYVCRKDISEELYAHYDTPPTYCKTHDDPQMHRERDEVERAQETAISKALSLNPDLTKKDLLIHEPTQSTSAGAAPRPKRAVPADRPFHRAYHAVRNAHIFPLLFQPPQPIPPIPPFQPPAMQIPQELRYNAAPRDNHAFNPFGVLPPVHREPWKTEDQLDRPPASLFQQQQPPRHAPGAGIIPERPPADHLGWPPF